MTYHGASTFARNILDWHLYMIAILDLQAQLRTSMSYFHIGVITDIQQEFFCLLRGEMYFLVASKGLCVVDTSVFVSW